MIMCTDKNICIVIVYNTQWLTITVFPNVRYENLIKWTISLLEGFNCDNATTPTLSQWRHIIGNVIKAESANGKKYLQMHLFHLQLSFQLGWKRRQTNNNYNGDTKCEKDKGFALFNNLVPFLSIFVSKYCWLKKVFGKKYKFSCHFEGEH